MTADGTDETAPLLNEIEEEQAALRRVATLVAAGTAPAALFASVVKEAVALFDADIVSINRLDPDGEVVEVALAASQGLADFPEGTKRFKLGPGFAAVIPEWQAGRAVRLDAADISSLELPEARVQQVVSLVSAAILVEGRIWGLMGVGSRRGPLPTGTEQRLIRFAELIAIAVACALAHAELRGFADEQAALRRVATLVARGVPPEEVLAAVTQETGQLLGANLAVITRYRPGHSQTLVSTWRSTPLPEDAGKPLRGPNMHTMVFETGQAAPIDDYAASSGQLAEDARTAGIRAVVTVPISIQGRLWGAMSVASTEGPLPPGTGERLAGFTELAATAIANAEARMKLRQFADDHAALRRVAMLVTRGAPLEEAFAAVAEEIGRVLALDAATLVKYTPDGAGVFVGVWARSGPRPVPVGFRATLGGQDVPSLVLRTGRPHRVDDYEGVAGPLAELASRLGLCSSVGVPVTVDGRLWGVLGAVSRSGPLPPGAETRLTRFTELTGTAIANAEARAALAVSRARIVAAADATRRRIEGQLNEAAQERLVSLARQLRAAQAAAPAGSELGQRLERMITETSGVLEQLREIARGLHPAVLADGGGLRPALTALAVRSAVPVRLDVRVAVRLPEPAELTAYYAVSEALTNIAKHAHASGAEVDVAAEGGVLRVRVRDDGRGGADFSRGSGLAGLRDRVEAVGGQISLRSKPEAGTTVEITLPLHDPGVPINLER
jgi:signal transduction histidine kinase